MAQQLHRVVAGGIPQPFDMPALRRLAIWGVSAAAALSVAVLAGYSHPVAQRLTGPRSAGIAQSERRAEAAPVPLASRSAEAETETRRLVDTVRALVADRNELVARIGTLEQSLQDITGAVNRQAGAASPPPQPPIETSAISSAPVNAPAVAEAVTALPEQRLSTPSQVAALPEIGGAAEADLLQPPTDLRTEFGVDLGTAVNFDALRVLWNATKVGFAAQLDGLSPLVTVRENSKSRATELRLIVGPLPDIETATRLCASLAAARRACQPTPYVGQHFALTTAPEPERKPAPLTERKAAPQPARQPVRPSP
jgi:hypothetical protein